MKGLLAGLFGNQELRWHVLVTPNQIVNGAKACESGCEPNALAITRQQPTVEFVQTLLGENDSGPRGHRAEVKCVPFIVSV